jgi:hypothetical protein
MDDLQILKDELLEERIVDSENLKRRKKNILDKLKPRNFLTTAELRETQEALRNMKLPVPTGWAHALSIHATEKLKDNFSPDRTYCWCYLLNLRAALHEAGLKNETIFRKLDSRVHMAEKYDIEECDPHV